MYRGHSDHHRQPQDRHEAGQGWPLGGTASNLKKNEKIFEENEKIFEPYCDRLSMFAVNQHFSFSYSFVADLKRTEYQQHFPVTINRAVMASLKPKELVTLLNIIEEDLVEKNSLEK